MKRLGLLTVAASVFHLASGAVMAQAELGGLPPIPNLDFGDPERKVSWRERRQADRATAERRQETSQYVRTPADTGAATLGDRVRKFGRENTIPQQRRIEEYNIANNISNPEDARTPTGSRLRPFGDDAYWGDLPDLSPEETLIDLPPLPDLRTPDQVTRRERVRDMRVARYEARQAETEAVRLQKERERAATVARPAVDPSSALVQVASRGDGSPSYYGNTAAPETVNQSTLKPFNEGSRFFEGNDLVYRGDEPPKPGRTWWRRGTSEMGESGDGLASRVQWRNPFAAGRDEVQPVAFDPGDSGAAFAASRGDLDATPLTSNLRGIRVVRSTREVSSGALGGINGLMSEGVDLPPRVQSVFNARIGRSLTLGELNQMVRDAVLAYRRSDFPVVDVLVPEQEITTGVLQLVVIEGRLGDVIVEGAGRMEGQSLASQIRTERGEVLRESELSQDLAWINKHPTRQVDLIFTPGRNYGETDVILRSQAYREISAYLAYENSGTQALGEDRGIFGASMVGPLFFGNDSILSYQFTTDLGAANADIFGHSAVFASYLPWRHQVTLLGAYVDSEASIDLGNDQSIEIGGVNKQGSGRYGIPLPGIGRMAHELQVGMDFKSSNSALGFNQIEVFDTTSEIVQYSLGYNVVARDQTGMWRVDAEVVNSPGGATNKNSDEIFQSQRAGATATYTYGRVMVERDQQLLQGWSLYGRLQGQASNSNLLSSETLGAGGFDSVRGFESRTVSGDRGLVGSIELRTPRFYPSTLAGFGNVRDGAYGLVFYDAGRVASHDPLPGEEQFTLGSVGVGFRYQKEEWFTLRVDYGFQVTEEGFDDGNSGRWDVGARVTF